MTKDTKAFGFVSDSREIDDRCDVLNTCVVDEDINGAHRFIGLVDKIADLVWARQIGTYVGYLDAMPPHQVTLKHFDLVRVAKSVKDDITAC
mmetsp:Transcript_26422/g.53086  ORF Transcript_26422/g.53086 Transcript_26422/m.53086 type:complete len:92 (-) Transcript_26422:173-448(-)